MPEDAKQLFTLEAVFAKHGDALLLHYGPWTDPKWVLIDGGPSGVYRDFLRPHLDFVRWLYDYEDDEPLPLELLMVSHIDADHIAGVLDLMREQKDALDEQRPAPFRIEQMWHNSFDEIIGNRASGHTTALLAAVASAADPDLTDDAGFAARFDRETRAVISGTGQGRDLRDLAKGLGIEVNPGMRGLVRRRKSGNKPVDMGHGLELHILGPDQGRIEEYQKEWDKDLAELQEKEKEAEAQALVDKSPFNLASICLLAEMQGQRMLLTGDARGDFILDGLEAFAGERPSPDAPFHVQILKMPHHGSDNNVDDNFFKSVTADHYVISGDGGYGNPEVATFGMIAKARGTANYQIDLTFPKTEALRRTTALRKEALALVDRWVKDEAPANCTVRYAEDRDDWHAIEVDLLDPLYPDGVGYLAAPADVRAMSAAQGGGSRNGPKSAAAETQSDRVERRDFLEDLIFSTGRQRERFTQQSPIMPDVWIHYGLEPHQPHDLLLTPDRDSEPGILAAQLRARCDAVGLPRGWQGLPALPEGAPDSKHGIAHNQNTVVARLWYHELLSAALPLSEWWREELRARDAGEPLDWLRENGKRDHLIAALKGEHPAEGPEIPPDVLWFVRLAGVIAHLFLHTGDWIPVQDLEAVRNDAGALVKALSDCVPEMQATDLRADSSLFSVNRNRDSKVSIHQSVGSVKGDAARRLFHVSGQNIRWAVVDSGIDAEHMAFRRRDAAGVPFAEPFATSGSGRRKGVRPKNFTRVRATYDFTRIREILSLDRAALDHLSVQGQLVELVRDPDPESERELKDRLADALRIDSNEAESRRLVDWKALEPFLMVEHAAGAYFPPVNHHGTHVAGIIGADWHDPSGGAPTLTGMCPEIELYDFRVLRDDGTGDEFSIMAALQFIRHFNTRFDYLAIHGVNLSFSIEHDVSNYACGQTPVCIEAKRLVDNRVVVVTAAGNSGRARYLTAHHHGGWQTDEGFRTVSITDPGNAEAVITVGATHRRDPHTYGVSYFSSRGPTGDGRLKPDLVAPGEKITSTVPGNGQRVLDGTSMAAPHVSGAAALLMSRHKELIGDPARIKRVLCESATDLGRERYFQGAGLVDILRALQAM